MSFPSPNHRRAAVALAEAAARSHPESAPRLLFLAEALEGAGERERALDLLAQARVAHPADEGLHQAYARSLGRAGDVDAALADLRSWPDSAWAAKLAFRLLIRHGRFAEAGAFEDAVAAADPADADLLDYRAARLRRDPEALLRLCDEVLATRPGAGYALYFKAIALAQLGRGEQAADLMAIDRFLSVAPLPAPEGFAGDAAFRELLAEEILANPTLHPDPAGHATRQGLRTREFPREGDRAGTALAGSIRSAVAAYSNALSGDHPFLVGRPDRATLTLWALVFRSSGRQLLHHHPGPWLTGVYYVRAPEGPNRAGAIRIGGLPDWAGVAPPWPVRDIAPEPGTLLLFPSFVPHETLATGSEEERISVAFDVGEAGR